MRRSDSAHHGYWQNVGLFGNAGMETHFPEGAMCLNALNEKGTRLSDIVIRVKNYLSVPLDIWEVGYDGKIKNDRGFDHQLYEYYKTNARALNKAIAGYSEPKRSPSIPTNRSGKLPPATTSAEEGRRSIEEHDSTCKSIRSDRHPPHLRPDDVDRADEI